MNDAGGLTFADDASAKSFADVMAGTKIGGLDGINLYEEFGAKTDFELRQAMEKPENAAKIHAWSKQGGIMMGDDGQGNIDVLKDPNAVRNAYNSEMDKAFPDRVKSGSSGGSPQLNLPGGGVFALLGKILGIE